MSKSKRQEKKKVARKKESKKKVLAKRVLIRDSRKAETELKKIVDSTREKIKPYRKEKNEET